MFQRELVVVAESLGIGTYGTDLFDSPRASIPAGAGPFTMIRATQGIAPVREHTDGGTPAFQRPGAQVMVVAADPADALSKIYDYYYAFASIQNQFIRDVWYLKVDPTSEPNELLPDSQNRARYAFNVLGYKEPSTAGGDLVGYYILEVFGGDRNGFVRPASPDSYPTGVTYDVIVPGSEIVIFSALPTGTLVLEASGRVESGGGRAKLALFNMNTDTPVTNGELTFSSGETVGERQRSGTLSLSIGTPYAIKGTTDNVAIGAAFWATRLLHL